MTGAPARLAARPLAAELRRLASLTRRLLPDRRDPERFHVERDHLERCLAARARRVEREGVRA